MVAVQKTINCLFREQKKHGQHSTVYGEDAAILNNHTQSQYTKFTGTQNHVKVQVTS